MKTYPVEFRHRVVQLTADGYATADIAAALGTSAAWVRSIKALHRSGRSLEPRSKANTRRSLAEREGDRIRARVAEKPGTTPDDLRRDLGLETSLSNLWNALRALKLSLKKSPSGRPSGTARTSPPTAPPGPSSPPASTPAASSSWTKPSARRR
jgi:transposase